MYTFSSSDADEAGTLLYGAITQTSAKGECEWTYTLPVSNLFNYELVLTKLSHITYPSVEILKTDVAYDKYAIEDAAELIVGDINADGVIKLPDRAELIRFLNQQRPWLLEADEFRKSDLNGDGAVSLFDLNLL